MVKSLNRRAAENGLIFGIYLSITSILLMLCPNNPNFVLLALIMFAGIPFIILYFFRKLYKDEFGFSRFSSLWMLGILIFIYGSLICGLVTYIYMEYIQPDYIYNLMDTALEVAKNENPKNEQVIEILSKAKEEKMIPTPIDLVMQMIWFSSFAGSILSIILAGITKLFKNRIKTL